MTQDPSTRLFSGLPIPAAKIDRGPLACDASPWAPSAPCSFCSSPSTSLQPPIAELCAQSSSAFFFDSCPQFVNGAPHFFKGSAPVVDIILNPFPFFFVHDDSTLLVRRARRYRLLRLTIPQSVACVDMFCLNPVTYTYHNLTSPITTNGTWQASILTRNISNAFPPLIVYTDSSRNKFVWLSCLTPDCTSYNPPFEYPLSAAALLGPSLTPRTKLGLPPLGLVNRMGSGRNALVSTTCGTTQCTAVPSPAAQVALQTASLPGTLAPPIQLASIESADGLPFMALVTGGVLVFIKCRLNDCSGQNNVYAPRRTHTHDPVVLHNVRVVHKLAHAPAPTTLIIRGATSHPSSQHYIHCQRHTKLSPLCRAREEQLPAHCLL